MPLKRQRLSPLLLALLYNILFSPFIMNLWWGVSCWSPEYSFTISERMNPCTFRFVLQKRNKWMFQVSKLFPQSEISLKIKKKLFDEKLQNWETMKLASKHQMRRFIVIIWIQIDLKINIFCKHFHFNFFLQKNFTSKSGLFVAEKY